MTISVITISYNSAETIEETILSVLNQSYKDIEYIIIDGGSEDGTLDILKKYKKDFKKMIIEKDRGIYDAMNKGLKHSTGDIVGFLNSDDMFYDKNAVKTIAENFIDQNTLYSYGDLIYVDRKNINQVVRFWKSSKLQEKDILKSKIPAHPTFYFRRKLIDKIGYFDISLKLASDFEYMLRFILKYPDSGKHINKLLIRMRVGGATSKSFKNIFKQNLEIFKAIKGTKLKLNISKFIFYKILNRIFQFTAKKDLSL